VFRSLMLVLACAAFANADEKKDPPKPKPKLTVELSGSVADVGLMSKAPENGVIVSEKAWKELADAWGLKDAPKVDFTKELLVVATTRGSRLNLTPSAKDGDLKTVAISTRDLRDGFRYAIKSHGRDGIKTVDGKALPKE
jgi:hypothetical protein